MFFDIGFCHETLQITVRLVLHYLRLHRKLIRSMLDHCFYIFLTCIISLLASMSTPNWMKCSVLQAKELLITFLILYVKSGVKFRFPSLEMNFVVDAVGKW